MKTQILFFILLLTGCFNITTGTKLYSIKEHAQLLMDTIPPEFSVINGLSAPNMPSSQQVTIWATDFIHSATDNNCKSTSLVYRIIKAKESDFEVPSTDMVTFNCQELGLQPVLIFVGDCGNDLNNNSNIEDNERNWAFKESYIIITDNDGVCPNPSTAIAIFNLVKMDGTPIPFIKLKTNLFNIMTDSNGFASAIYPGLVTISNLIIEEPVWTKSNVSILDLVLQLKIKNYELVPSIYQLIAGDVSFSNSFNTLDIIKTTDFILKKTSSFEGQRYRYTFKQPYPYSPLVTSAYVSQKGNIFNYLPNTILTDTIVKLIAIELGDMNPVLPKDMGVMKPILPVKKVNNKANSPSVNCELIENQKGRYQLIYKGSEQIEGAFIQINSTIDQIFIQSTEDEFNQMSSELVWLSTRKINPGEILIEFSSNESINSSSITGSAVTNVLEELELVFPKEHISDLQIENVYPNPSNGFIEIPVNLTKASFIKATITDTEGKNIYVSDNVNIYDKGKHIVPINLKLGTGVYFIKIETEFEQKVQKVIVSSH